MSYQPVLRTVLNPNDMPSSFGWKARSDKAEAKRTAKQASVAATARFYNAISVKDRAANAHREAVERRDALVANIARKRDSLEGMKRDRMQTGRVHPSMMQLTFELDSSGPLIDAAEADVVAAQSALDVALTRYAETMAEFPADEGGAA